MANILEAIRLIVSGQTIAGSRAERGWVDGWSPPAVLFRRDGGPRDPSDNRIDVARIVFESYGLSDGQAYHLAMEVDRLMLPGVTEGYTGTVETSAGPLHISGARIDAGPSWTPTEGQTPCYRSSYLVPYFRPAPV